MTANAGQALMQRALARFIGSPEAQAAVEKRVVNWRRWLNEYDSHIEHGSCGSAERRYRPEKLTQAECDIRTAARGTVPIDVTDAERVDLALRQLPVHVAELLRRCYYRMESPWKIARLLGFGSNIILLNERRLLALLLLSRRLSLLDMQSANRCAHRVVRRVA